MDNCCRAIPAVHRNLLSFLRGAVLNRLLIFLFPLFAVSREGQESLEEKRKRIKRKETYECPYLRSMVLVIWKK